MIGILRKGEVETRLEPIRRDGIIPFWIVAPSLGGLPNQLGSGSETNSLEAGMCTRGIENNEGGLRFSYHIMVQHSRYRMFALLQICFLRLPSSAPHGDINIQ